MGYWNMDPWMIVFYQQGGFHSMCSVEIGLLRRRKVPEGDG